MNTSAHAYVAPRRRARGYWKLQHHPQQQLGLAQSFHSAVLRLEDKLRIASEATTLATRDFSADLRIEFASYVSDRIKTALLIRRGELTPQMYRRGERRRLSDQLAWNEVLDPEVEFEERLRYLRFVLDKVEKSTDTAPHTKQVFLLYHSLGPEPANSSNDVAEQMGITPQSVRSSVGRTLEKFFGIQSTDDGDCLKKEINHTRILGLLIKRTASR